MLDNRATFQNTAVTPAGAGLRQEDGEFWASVDHIIRICLKKILR